jgi:peptide/nickel transport system substrate-binding protein
MRVRQIKTCDHAVRFMKQRSIISGLLFFLLITGVSACSDSNKHFPWQPVPSAVITPSATNTATLLPPRELTICLGEEPESLYIYAQQQTVAMWSILEAIYDGPIDLIAGKHSAVILQKIPTYEDGDLTKASEEVVGGELVVDANNQVVVMQKGTRFLPAGCKDSSCALIWDGATPVQMDQVSAVFKLRANLLWSDGTPLTAADSRFSFEVASDPATDADRNTIDRTSLYEVVDDLTIRWTGVPGYHTAEVTGMFWVPLPKHILAEIPVVQLADSEQASRKPIGWGPYTIKEWVAGNHISLIKNGNYFRAGEGLPRFDQLTFRFIDPAGAASLAALASGQCDLVERSSSPQSDISLVEDLLNSTQATGTWAYGPEILQLVMGIKSAAYDNGYSALLDRPDYFGDLTIRKALAACIDRQLLLEEVFGSHAKLASMSDMLGNQSGSAVEPLLAYDPDYGRLLLDQAGWMDVDGDPATPRQAVSVPGVTTGTPLSLTLLIPADSISIATGTVISSSLAGCGIEVKPTAIPFAELYAPGPEGLIFGRSFDLVLITWQYSQVPACQLYLTTQIPVQENHWIGGNVSGYANVDFDMACSNMIHAMPGDEDYELSLREAVTYFTVDMPAIPLIKLPKLVIAGPGICAFSYEPSARSDLTNLELINYGAECDLQ